MTDDDIVPVAEALEWQRDYATRLGSPVAALILQSALDSLAELPLIPAHVRFGSLPGLRIMAAVHRLAIDRQAPGVAMHLPTLGGTPPHTATQPGFSGAVVSALRSNPHMLTDYLERIPQTNEVGRARLLRAALSRLDPSTPVALYEFGCSAGLNLMADVLPGVAEWEVGDIPRIVGRRGCDLRPVDAATVDGRALLSSYIWVDDVDRWARLQSALRVREQVDVTVTTSDAEAFIRGITLSPGVCTVIWHSAMWVYLDASQREGITDAIEALGEQAHSDSSVVVVSWELGDHRQDNLFELAIRQWDGVAHKGERRVIATGLSHAGDVTMV